MSMLRRFVAVAVSALALTMLCGGLPLIAQESGTTQAPSKSKTKTGKRAFDPARRVPMYFGQLGLSDDQREEIYKIQGKHLPKIVELEKQIETLRGQMVQECEGVLTAPQKKTLEQRRAGGADSRSKKGSKGKAKSE